MPGAGCGGWDGYGGLRERGEAAGAGLEGRRKAEAGALGHAAVGRGEVEVEVEETEEGWIYRI
jgi:hypothetical protein